MSCVLIDANLARLAPAAANVDRSDLAESAGALPGTVVGAVGALIAANLPLPKRRIRVMWSYWLIASF